MTFCCLVNNFSTICKIALLEHDLGIVKRNTNKIGNVYLPMNSSWTCYKNTCLLSCLLLTPLSREKRALWPGKCDGSGRYVKEE